MERPKMAALRPTLPEFVTLNTHLSKTFIIFLPLKLDSKPDEQNKCKFKSYNRHIHTEYP